MFRNKFSNKKFIAKTTDGTRLKKGNIKKRLAYFETKVAKIEFISKHDQKLNYGTATD